MGVAVRRCIDILIIIITFPYSTCISSFLGSSIPISLFIFKMFFRSCEDIIVIPKHFCHDCDSMCNNYAPSNANTAR